MTVVNLFSCLLAFFVTSACIALLRPLAIRIGLVDSPAGRKQHSGDIPLIGGIAMFLGFLFALLTLSVSLLNYRSFIAAAALLILIGILDDFHELPPKSRFLAQIAAALLMTAWGEVMLQNLGNFLFAGDIVLGNWGLPMTVLAVVGIINAINMMDGVDGLAGTLSLVALIFLAALSWYAQLFNQLQILGLIIAVLLAFLCFNFRFAGRKQALVFMGDAGSMFLGFSLVWFLVDLSQGTHKVLTPVVMLYIMALPLFDISSVVISRLYQGKSPFSPDRGHLHHLLQAVGFTPARITLIMGGAALIIGLVGIVGFHMGSADGVLFVIFLIMFVVYLRFVKWLKK